MADKKDMAMILGGNLLRLTKAPEKILQPNETNNVTLGGTLYTDFKNQLRAWKISWDYIDHDDYDTIMSMFDEQYTNGTYKMFQFDAYSIYSQVKIEVPENHKLVFNGRYVENFYIILREKYAVS